ncbi:helix-turn-helix domain-containing protein [Streptomyces boncukensis]|uniref:Helix-turn-helix domain-containing protein n=1 Tax=Streptomyces boncukensis TaxID=2711219 RepID=A0A6G4WQT3_9ACTN|nr:helix-turn-helix transcriptional regulator [Streptomyces boncukensis]NGO67458.1 helix-turn-helix domain-containing protein [Streptomyces boncukensis]
MNSDAESATPALCRLQLGCELKQLRQSAGLKANQVVKQLIWSPSKLTRLESGENAAVEPADVMALCEIYGADKETRETLLGYASVTKTKRDWWQSPEHRPAIRPGLKAFLGLEATASALQTYHSEFVPGLLQCAAYVRAIYDSSDRASDPDELDRFVATRVARQDVLHRENAPLKLTAIINEAVLRRAVGGADVMREQLNHLAEVADSLPNVRIQVMPFSHGAHTGMNGSFVVLRFPERLALKPIVYLENLADAWVNRREADVSRYTEAFTDLQALAPGPKESLKLIKEAAKEH